MFAQRVRRANLHAALLVRFVQRREQQHQERHVIRQRQAAGKAVPLLEHPAQAAVAALIAILLRLRQPLQICDHMITAGAFADEPQKLLRQRLLHTIEIIH